MNRAFFRPFALALLLTLFGCRVSPQSFETPATIRDPVPAVRATTPANGVTGFVELAIHWPDTGFKAAVIPSTTNAIGVRIRKGANLFKEAFATREATATIAVLTLEVEATADLEVEVRAFRQAKPNWDQDAPIAKATSSVTVKPSQTASLIMVLDPAVVPTVSSLNVVAGVPGSEVTLTGTNFGSGAIPVSVTFNGTPSTSVSRTNETTLVAKVPAGATTGYVKVSADGVPSPSGPLYWVLNAYGIEAPKAPWDTSAASSRFITFGSFLQLTATSSVAFKPGESSVTFGVAPKTGWSRSNSLAGVLGASSGLFQAVTNLGTGLVTAQIGSAVSTLSITIFDPNPSWSAGAHDPAQPANHLE